MIYLRVECARFMREFFLKVMVQLRKILVLIIGIATYVLWP